MTGQFVAAYVLLAIGAFGWAILGAVFADDDAPPGSGLGSFVVGVFFTVLGLAFFMWAVQVETTCSVQGMHTVGGECVKLVTSAG